MLTYIKKLAAVLLISLLFSCSNITTSVDPEPKAECPTCGTVVNGEIQQCPTCGTPMSQ